MNHTANRIRTLHRLCAILGVMMTWLVPGGVPIGHADILHIPASKGMTLNAEYHRGDIHRPAILVLHGFLQTYEFLSTQNIISGLSALGYTTLGPNLSLGIPDRRQSMQCRAPHQHSFDNDLREINHWVDWLHKQGHAKVIIVGHSWGSQHGLGYAYAYPRAPVAAVIAISLVRAEQPAAIQRQQAAAARARLARHDISLQPYALSYCKSYVAKPESYLSYALWDDAHTLDTVAQLHRRGLPVYVVVGSEDRRIDKDWVQALRPLTSEVSVMQGANHFFSSIYEFELNDRLEAILGQISRAADKPAQ